jgi:putative nucleotidyltransferase with HDIG domain
MPQLPPKTPISLRDAVIALNARMDDGKVELPMLPEVALRVAKMTADADCDSRQLADLIRRDQAVAGNLLRVANSALYARGIPIESLQVALGRLGMQRIREIVMAISCQTRVFQCPAHDDEVRAVFRHSLAAATYAAEIARIMRKSVDDAFVFGLLHDIGRPVAMQTLIDIAESNGWAVENGVFSGAVTAVHTVLGAEIVKKWGLSERIVEAIRAHHATKTAGDPIAWGQLRFADDLAHWAIETPEGAPTTDLEAHAALDTLNLYPEDVKALLDQKSKIKSIVESYA